MNKPIYIEWDKEDGIGLCGIVGKSGTGKSSTIRFLAAQLALAGVGLIIIDGHGKIGEQNLAQTLQVLDPAMLVPVVTEDNDIISTIRAVAEIAHRRLNGIDKDTHQRVALIIDEYISILRRLPKEQANEVIEIMLRFAVEYRKTGVACFIAAQNWGADFIGAKSIRSSLKLMLMHRMSADEIKSFPMVDSISRKYIPTLKTGELFIFDGKNDPTRVKVPRVTQDDLVALEGKIPFADLNQPNNAPQRNKMPILEESEELEPQDNAPQRNKPQNQGYVNPPKNARIIAQAFIDNALQWDESIDGPFHKVKLIKKVLNIGPGRNKTYLAASKLYDALKDRNYF